MPFLSSFNTASNKYKDGNMSGLDDYEYILAQVFNSDNHRDLNRDFIAKLN